MTDTLMQNTDVQPSEASLTPKGAGEYGSLVVPDRNAHENNQVRQADQRLEQQMLYADLAPALASVIIKAAAATTGDRRRLAQAQDDVRLAEGPVKKKRLSSSSLDDETVQQLVSILGVDAAQKVVEVVDKLNAEVTKTQNITTGQKAQLEKDIASALAGKESIQHLGLAAQAVENAKFDRNSGTDKSTGDAVTEHEILEMVDSVATKVLDPEGACGSPVVYRERAALLADIIGSSKQNPQILGEILAEPQGIIALQKKLVSLVDTKSRVAFLAELKTLIGADAFGHVVDSYEIQRGTPLAYQILELAGPGKDAMRASLPVILEKQLGLLSPDQTARLASFMSQRHGEMLAVYDRNRDELHNVAAQYERTIAQAQVALSKILADESLAKPVVISREEVAAHVVARLPGLKGKSLKEMHAVVAAAATTDDQDQGVFYKAVEGLGFKQLPDQYDSSEAAKGKNQEIRRTLERIAAPLEQLSEAFNGRTKITERLKENSVDIASIAETDLLQLLSPHLPEYTAQSLDQNRREARVELSASEVRIEQLRSQPERAAECALLCQERDSIEWQATSYQVTQSLQANPKDSSEVQRLLLEFQSLPTGTTGRSEVYLRAASALQKEIEAIDVYVKTVEAIRKTSEKTVKSLTLDIEYLHSEIAEQQDNLPSSWWDPAKYGEGTNKILNLQTKIEHERKTMSKWQDALRCATTFLGKDPVALGTSLYDQMVNRSEPVVDGTTKFPKIRIFDEPSAESQISDTFKQYLEARKNCGDALTGCVIPRSTVASAQTGLPATRADESLLQIDQLNALLTKDFTLEPSKEALAALRGVLDSKNAIGAALSDSSLGLMPPREQMNHLYARISGDDAVRVKLFLLTFDRPENLALLDKTFGKSAEQIPPGEVWRGISSRKPDEIAPYVSAMSAMRTMQEASRQLLQLPIEKLEDVRSEYLRITGQTLGEAVLAVRPGGRLGQEFLYSFADSPLLTNGDLKPFIGVKIDGISSLPERKNLMGVLLQSDEVIKIDDGTSATSAIAERLKKEAPERAALATAYQSLVQQGRIDEALAAGARLKEMDSALTRFVSKDHETYSAEFIARSGVVARISDRAALELFERQANTVSTAAKRAKEIASYMSDDSPAGAIILELVREMALSEGEMLLVSALYREHVASPLREQGKTPLSGDLANDLAMRGAYSEASSSDTQRVKNLLQGGPKALTSYDLESLTEGIRTRNPRLTVKSMMALEGRGLLQRSVEGLENSSSAAREAFSQFKESPEGREIGAYLKAAKENDAVTRGVIELKNGVAFATQDPLGSLSALVAFRNAYQGPGLVKAVAAYKGIYRADMMPDLGKIVPPCLSSSVSSVLSSDAAQYAKAPLIIAQQALGNTATAVNQKLLSAAIAMAPDEASRKALTAGLNEFVAGMPDAMKYRDAQEPSVVQYVRVTGGTLGVEKANLLSDLLKGSINPNSQRVTQAQQLEEIDEFEQHYGALTSLQKKGEVINAQAIEFYQTIASSGHNARHEQANRTVSKSRAKVLENHHNEMLKDQKSLMGEQRGALGDVRGTKQSMTNRMQCRLEDHSAGEESIFTMDGIRAQAADTSRRFALVEWVAVRHDAFVRWQIDARNAQNRLESFDNWVTIGTAVAKVVVITAVAITATPVTAFAVATAWNVGEKTFRCAFNGLSLKDALRQGAFDLAFDVAFVGLSAIRILKITAVGTHQGTEAAGKTVFGKWVVTVGRPGSKAADIGRGGIFHPREVGQYLREGANKPLRTALGLVEKVAQDPKVLSQYVDISVRRVYTEGVTYLAKLTTVDASKKSQSLPVPVNQVIGPIIPNSLPQAISNQPGDAKEPPVLPINLNQSPSPATPGGGAGQLITPAPIPSPIEPLATPQNAQPGTPGVAATPGGAPVAQQGAQNVTPVNAGSEPPANTQPATGGAGAASTGQGPAPQEGAVPTPAAPANQSPAAPAPAPVQPAPIEPPLVQLLAATPPPPPQPPPEPEEDIYEKALQDYIDGLGEGLVWMFHCPPTRSRGPSNPPPVFPPSPPPTVADVSKPKKPARPPAGPSGDSGPVFATSGEKSINSYTAYQADRNTTVTASALETSQPIGVVSSNTLEQSITQSLAMSNAEATSMTLAVSNAATQGEMVPEMVSRTAALVEAASADPWQVMAASEGEFNRHAKQRSLALQAVAEQGNSESVSLAALRLSEEQSNTARVVAEASAAATAVADAETKVTIHRSEALSSRQQVSDSEVNVRLAALVEKDPAPALKTKQAVSAEESTISLTTGSEQTSAGPVSAQLASSTLTNSSMASPSSTPSMISVVSLKESSDKLSSEKTQETTEARDAKALIADSQKAIQEEIRLHHRETTARLVAQEQSDIATLEASQDRAEAARKAKANRAKRQIKADERLRESIIHQLKTRQFQAAEQDKLMALLKRLGISQKEYFALVAVLGELEAQRHAAGLKAFKEPIALEVEEENSHEDADGDLPSKGAIRGTLFKKDEVVVSALDAAKKTTRGALFARLRQPEE